jgi:hypothetical protein
MQSKTDIGFGKKIRLAWLDSALDCAAAGQSFEEAKEALGREIAATNSGPEAIRKIQTALKRVWFAPPERCLPLRADALGLFQKSGSPASRLILHWGMSIAAYPFVGSVGEALGRLLKLQKEVRLGDVERRIREQHGDRDFIGRVARYDFSSFLDWAVIAETETPGIYRQAKPVRPPSGELAAWLVEALMISRDKTQLQFAEIRNHPALFPIQMESLHASTVTVNPRLKLVRQNMNDEFVIFG